MNNDEMNFLVELKEMEKKQLKNSRMQTLLLLVVAVVIVGTVVNTSVKMQRVMETVEHMDELTLQIRDELNTLDIDKLNSSIDNLDTITSDMMISVKNFREFTERLNPFR